MTDVVRSGPIRYARAARFAPPERTDPAVVEPTDGSICPQPPSRLERVVGAPSDVRPQGEDCLALSVVAPATPGPHPVLVFLHGGAFSSGAGLLSWYDGGSLAAEQGVVVVSVNYRLGPFGWLLLDGVSPGNLGLSDQIAALEWVRDGIAAFGGEPDAVTVFGQSAGGVSIAAMLAEPSSRALFRRAVVQSGPELAAFAGSRPEEAAARGRRFAELLDADPVTASPGDLLAAVGRLARETVGAVEPPLLPVLGVGPVGAGAPTGDVGDVLVGWNRDEMSAFGTSLDEAPAASRPLFAEWAEGGVARAGYRLDWRPSAFGATHCLELPLLLGDRAAWSGSPMLGGTPWAEVDAMGRRLRAVWAGFARTGRLEPDAELPIAWAPDGDLTSLSA